MKRGALVLSSTVVTVILIVFGLVVMGGLYNLLTRGGEAVTGLEDEIPAAPQVDEPLQQIQMPDDNQKKQWESLIATLNKDVQGPCLLKYDGLDKLEGWSIRFTQAGAMRGSWFASLINPRNVPVLHADVNKELCVVAGTVEKADYSAVYQRKQREAVLFNKIFTKFGAKPSTIIAENFYNNWIAASGTGQNSNRKIVYIDKQPYTIDHAQYFVPDYSHLRTVTLNGANSIIFVTGDGTSYSTGKEDGGLFYVPEKENVCFLATFDDWGIDSNFDKKGIHNSQISSIKWNLCR